MEQSHQGREGARTGRIATTTLTRESASSHRRKASGASRRFRFRIVGVLGASNLVRLYAILTRNENAYFCLSTFVTFGT